ncbi:MAG TPA: hypothetical protein VKB34_22005 [Povalibacter sp.]|nr:hypothetical protein [Povalibacter sp.]
MNAAEFLLRASVALAVFAAAPLAVLWIGFTCQEIRQVRALARSGKTTAIDDVGASSTV